MKQPSKLYSNSVYIYSICIALQIPMESGFVSPPEDWKFNSLNVCFVSNIPP